MTATLTSPATTARDFRKAFYTSIGIKDVKDTKAAVDALLQEETIDLDQLAKICLYYQLPHASRLMLWKLLLGVLPPLRPSWDFVVEQRMIQLIDLLRATPFVFGPAASLATTSPGPTLMDSLTPTAMVQMVLINHGLTRRFDQADLSYLEAIARVFLRVYEDDYGAAFWTFVFFIKTQNLLSIAYLEQPLGRVQHQVNALHRMCQGDERLNQLVRDTQSELDLVIQLWFRDVYATTLPLAALERVYDVIIGGSPSIIIYVAMALLLAQGAKLKGLQRKTAIVALYQQMSEDSLANAVDQAIEMWDKSQS